MRELRSRVWRVWRMAVVAVLAGPAVAAVVESGTAAMGDIPSEIERPAAAGVEAPVVPGALPSPPAADPAASAATLAAELIREADAGTAAPAAAHDSDPAAKRPQPRTTTTRSAASRQGEDADADEWGLKAAGKSALDWMKSNIPWVGSQKDQDDTANPAPDWSQSPPEGGADWTGQTRRPQPATSSYVDRADSKETTPRFGRDDPGRDLIRETVAVIRQILEHPMTWLVLALFVIGGIVMSKVDRRPK